MTPSEMGWFSKSMKRLEYTFIHPTRRTDEYPKQQDFNTEILRRCSNDDLTFLRFRREVGYIIWKFYGNFYNTYDEDVGETYNQYYLWKPASLTEAEFIALIATTLPYAYTLKKEETIKGTGYKITVAGGPGGAEERSFAYYWRKHKYDEFYMALAEFIHGFRGDFPADYRYPSDIDAIYRRLGVSLWMHVPNGV